MRSFAWLPDQAPWAPVNGSSRKPWLARWIFPHPALLDWMNGQACQKKIPGAVIFSFTNIYSNLLALAPNKYFYLTGWQPTRKKSVKKWMTGLPAKER